MARAPIAAAVDGLSKLRGALLCWAIIPDVAGDFLNCWGDERGPRGEKTAWAGFEKGVDTGGVAAANCEGVRPCCEATCFMAVGVAMAMCVWWLA